MSLQTNVNSLTQLQIDDINNDLTVTDENIKYGRGQKKTVFPFEDFEDENKQQIINVPFAYGFKNLKINRPFRSSFENISDNMRFEGLLRPEQEIVKNEALVILNSQGSVILSMYCGFGKTITSVYLASLIKLKTLIVVNKIVLMNQWICSIRTHCPAARIVKLEPKQKNKTINECDFVIINILNIPKFNRDFFSSFGCVIIDEAHLIMAEKIAKGLLFLRPRYLIGLSATPYRPDGFDKLIDLYFGDKRIIRELYHPHTVFKVNTEFKPEFDLTADGKINWSSVINSQAFDENRNNMIVKIIRQYKERMFLVLVKRVQHGEYLAEKLKNLNESVTTLLGSNQLFDKDARILIGTVSKVGTGFDHPKIDALMLACDVEGYFIQYLGRCMRTVNMTPFIFDLVDNLGILVKHYNTRKQVYLKHGGIIQKYTP